MDLKLKGKNALVTGSSRGIGNAIAKLLHEEGCNVTLNGRNEESLSNSLSSFEKNIYSCIADVTNPNDCKHLIEKTIDRWGSIDILVCNVGNGTSVKPGNEDSKEWEKVFLNNFFSTVNVINAATVNLSKAPKSIICISSIAGIESIGAPVAYSVAKSAINSYVKNSSKYLAKSGIRINAVVPGNIMFETSVWKKKLLENPVKVEKMLKEEVAMEKFGTPEDVANLTIFLCSQRSSFVTGSMFVIDGGQTKS
jgi:3-oxoacyl-[acyl-carrier protein] reductase